MIRKKPAAKKGRKKVDKKVSEAGRRLARQRVLKKGVPANLDAAIALTETKPAQPAYTIKNDPRQLPIFGPNYWWDYGDIAKALDVSVRTVRRMVRDKKLPEPARLGHRLVRFERHKIEQLINEGKIGREVFNGEGNTVGE